MISNNSKNLLMITTVALLIALDVILTRFLSINTTFLRITFGMIPVALAGACFGPVWGAICGSVGDILGMMIFPSGSYFPGFTLTAALTGLIYGLFLYRKETEHMIRNTIIASVLVCIGCNLILDTLWLYIMYGNGIIASIPLRVVKCAVNIPIYSVLVLALWDKVFSRIPLIRSIQQ